MRALLNGAETRWLLICKAGTDCPGISCWPTFNITMRYDVGYVWSEYSFGSHVSREGEDKSYYVMSYINNEKKKKRLVFFF